MTAQNDLPQRRQKSRELIDHMLAEREAMFVLLWKVSGRVEHDHSESDHAIFTDFFSVLVDYIAAGHFGLYQRIAEGNERRQAVQDTATRVYPRISEISEAALDFNDRFGGEEEPEDRTALDKAIETLSELLVERIELEDQLIEAMLGEAPDSPLPA